METAQLPDHAGWLRGKCHCGAISFSFRITNDFFTQCNCTYCTRKAAKHYRVDRSGFNLDHPQCRMIAYKFGTGRAEHFFCSRCGVHVYCHPRSAPNEINVNLNCVLDVHIPWMSALKAKAYDGRALFH